MFVQLSTGQGSVAAWMDVLACVAVLARVAVLACMAAATQTACRHTGSLTEGHAGWEAEMRQWERQPSFGEASGPRNLPKHNQMGSASHSYFSELKKEGLACLPKLVTQMNGQGCAFKNPLHNYKQAGLVLAPAVCPLNIPIQV